MYWILFKSPKFSSYLYVCILRLENISVKELDRLITNVLRFLDSLGWFLKIFMDSWTGRELIPVQSAIRTGMFVLIFVRNALFYQYVPF